MSKRRRLTIVVIVVALGLVCLWFTAVDYSVFFERSTTTRADRAILQYRVFGRAVHETVVETSNVMESIGRDLGVKDEWVNAERVHWQRYWGLLMCACPCMSSVWGMEPYTGGYEYSEELGKQARRLAASDPEITEEYRRRVLMDRDSQFFAAIMQRLGAEVECTEHE